MKTTATRLALASLLGALCMNASGCASGGVGWSTYRPSEENPGRPAANSTASRGMMVHALAHSIRNYPPAPGINEVAINLPPGMTPVAYYDTLDRVADLVEPSGIRVRALTPQTESLPIYHIAGYRARIAEGKVDVLRPVLGLGESPDARPNYQPLTLSMYSNGLRWDVDHMQFWRVGSMEAPALTYAPQATDLPGNAAPTPPATEPDAEAAADEPDPAEPADGAIEVTEPGGGGGDGGDAG